MPPGASPTMMVMGLLGSSSARTGENAAHTRTTSATTAQAIVLMIPPLTGHSRAPASKITAAPFGAASTVAQRRWRGKSGRGAPCNPRRVESGCRRILLAHIGALLGLAVISAAADVVDHRPWIDPDHIIGRAARLGV